LDDTTERLTATAGSFLAGKVLEQPGDLPVVDLDEDDSVEHLYCIGWAGATVTDTYDFRLSGLDTYSVTPRATIGYGGMVVKAP
jgi:hypothetical protein